MGSLDGLDIVVTGAGRGLGFSIADRVARLGAHVWIAEIYESGGRCAVDEIRDGGGSADYVHVDIADPGSVAMMAATVQRDGPVYGLVNNAALAEAVGGKLFHEIEVEQWDRLMLVNARGPWLVTKALVEGMINRRSGRIVNVASDTALYGPPRLAHYVSSKGAVIALTRAMARELGEHDITVNCLAPGLTITDSTAGIPADRHDLYQRNRALRRPQKPCDVAGAAAFLLGPESSYLTGQLLVVDGGFVLH
jgi:NAD(P)-dependent dehydrogenase (short-subunit alcohol dehydrogenase family)